MTFGSLFAGIGGLDLGFERAGLKCLWQVEINPFSRRVLQMHWPEVPKHDDVRTFPHDCQQAIPVEVICGGFPCKQTSVAAAIHGRRNGLSGKDSGLWYEMQRIVGQLQPRIVVVENPPSRFLATVSRGLAKLGYRVHSQPLQAAGVGAPHLRRRVFVISHRHKSRLEIARAFGSSPTDGEPGGTANRDVWVSSLAGVLRVDDGIPGRVDRRERIIAVGNAVVPQVAELIGRRLMNLEGLS